MRRIFDVGRDKASILMYIGRTISCRAGSFLANMMDPPKSRMYGKAACPVLERDRRSTGIWKRYCGTTAKAGGNRENKLLPVVTEGSCLLEQDILGLDFIFSPLFYFFETYYSLIFENDRFVKRNHMIILSECENIVNDNPRAKPTSVICISRASRTA